MRCQRYLPVLGLLLMGLFVAHLRAEDVKCAYRFFNVQNEGNLAQVREVIKTYALEQSISSSSGSEASRPYIELAFTVRNVDDIAKIGKLLPFAASGATKDSPAFEEFSPRFTTTYRTVDIDGSIEVTVRFLITPGADLLYSVEKGKEIPVDRSEIDSSGKVALSVRIPRNQASIFARTMLGKAEKFMKIDIETGNSVHITRDEYQEHAPTTSVRQKPDVIRTGTEHAGGRTTYTFTCPAADLNVVWRYRKPDHQDWSKFGRTGTYDSMWKVYESPEWPTGNPGYEIKAEFLYEGQQRSLRWDSD